MRANNKTMKRRTIFIWLTACAAVFVLLGVWVGLSRGYFDHLKLRENPDKATSKRAPKGSLSNLKNEIAFLETGVPQNRTARVATPIGDPWDAVGKSADVEVCGFGIQHVEEFPMGISLPPVTASNETLNAAARNLASSKIDAERALGLY